MDQDLELRYAIVRDREKRFVHNLARSIIQKPRLTGWMFLAPILFIYHAQQIRIYQENLSKFRHGVSRIKLHALNMAHMEMSQGRRAREHELDLYADLDLDEPCVLKVRDRQLGEVLLLRSHYWKLLNVTGRDYFQLVQNAYKTRNNYKQFLYILGEKEKKVNRAVLEAFHDDEHSRDVVFRMEERAAALRSQEAETIFSA